MRTRQLQCVETPGESTPLERWCKRRPPVEERSRSSSRSRGKRRTRSRSLKRTRSRSRSGSTEAEAQEDQKRINQQETVTPARMSARIASMKEKTEDAVSEKPKFESLEDDSKETRLTKHTGFGSQIGAVMSIIIPPFIVYFVTMACSKENCNTTHIPSLLVDWRSVVDIEATLIFLGWFFFQAFLYMIPVGRVVLGQPTIIGNNARLPYRCNGFFAFVTSLLAFCAALYYKVPVTKVYDKFLPLMTTACIFSFVYAVFMYIKSASEDQIAPGGNTKNVIYDFFMGHELNPRIGQFDFKFCTMRPGLIGWTMLNLIFLARDFEQDGKINPSLALVAFFQGLYVADILCFEDFILTTMDFIFEGFGFLLIFGDLACWSIPSPYHVTGFYTFRGSNSQKNEFRKNPNNPALAHLETIPTKKGKRLLVSGWWGLCRKPNYLGDLMMALSWSLPCGFRSVWPYFYPIYLLFLLIHRERRDDAMCKKKYEAAWDTYCQKVKYRIFPKLY